MSQNNAIFPGVEPEGTCNSNSDQNYIGGGEPSLRPANHYKIMNGISPQDGNDSDCDAVLWENIVLPNTSAPYQNRMKKPKNELTISDFRLHQ